MARHGESRLAHPSQVGDRRRDRQTTGFDEFFEREEVPLFPALCLMTRNPFEAEELTQDAFVRVLERWDRVSQLVDRAQDDAAVFPRDSMVRSVTSGGPTRTINPCAVLAGEFDLAA
jgi:hypothetical protein